MTTTRVSTEKRIERELIQRKTAEFLANGGSIYQAEHGESGVDYAQSAYIKSADRKSAQRGMKRSSRRRFG